MATQSNKFPSKHVFIIGESERVIATFINLFKDVLHDLHAHQAISFYFHSIPVGNFTKLFVHRVIEEFRVIKSAKARESIGMILLVDNSKVKQIKNTVNSFLKDFLKNSALIRVDTVTVVYPSTTGEKMRKIWGNKELRRKLSKRARFFELEELRQDCKSALQVLQPHFRILTPAIRRQMDALQRLTELERSAKIKIAKGIFAQVGATLIAAAAAAALAFAGAHSASAVLASLAPTIAAMMANGFKDIRTDIKDTQKVLGTARAAVVAAGKANYGALAATPQGPVLIHSASAMLKRHTATTAPHLSKAMPEPLGQTSAPTWLAKPQVQNQFAYPPILVKNKRTTTAPHLSKAMPEPLGQTSAPTWLAKPQVQNQFAYPPILIKNKRTTTASYPSKDTFTVPISIKITPSELCFKRPFNKEVGNILCLQNTNQEPIVFKVKTTAPEQYCVCSTFGRVEPGKTIGIHVVLQAMKKEPAANTECNDKFLIQFVTVARGIELATIASVFEKAIKASVVERKVRVNWLASELPLVSEESKIMNKKPLACTPPRENFEDLAPNLTKKRSVDQSSSTTIPHSSEKPVKSETYIPIEHTSVFGTTKASVASSSSYDNLQAQLGDANVQIQSLKHSQNGLKLECGAVLDRDQGLQQQKTAGEGPAAPIVLATLQQTYTNSKSDVSVQVVAGLCMLSFLIGYLFF